LNPRIDQALASFPRSEGKVQIAGICDLLVVKQQLVGYEGAEVAQ
jgi:hypothetical protein